MKKRNLKPRLQRRVHLLRLRSRASIGLRLIHVWPVLRRVKPPCSETLGEFNPSLVRCLAL